MELHKHWNVSEKELERLKGLSSSELKKEIKSKRLFVGISTRVAEAKEKAIYEKINPRRTKRKSSKANTAEDKKRGREDSKQ